VPGSLEQAGKGIKNIKSFNWTVEVNIVINKYNYRFLPQTVKFLIGLNVDNIKIVFAEPKKDGLTPAIDLFVPYVHKSIDKALLLNRIVKTENIPQCCMVAYKRYMTENDKENSFEIHCNGLKNTKEDIKKRKSKTKPCVECKYNIICDGLWTSYLQRFGYKGIKSITHKGLITDNERCMISILLKENNIPTKRMLQLKSSDEFKDICANCVGSDDVVVTGNNLVEKNVVRKTLGKHGYVWSLVDGYDEILKERGVL
jgi:hypothetical protein